MAQELDQKDLRRRRAQRRRAKFLKKLAAVVVVAAVGMGIYLTREQWVPFFDGIATRYVSMVENDGELAAGNFPLRLASGLNYQTASMERALAVLNDTHFYTYDPDGNLLYESQHNYSNPVLYAGTKKSLLYDQGGTSFSVFTRYKVSYSARTSDKILLGRLNPTGEIAAMVTQSDQYVSIVSVYNAAGEVIFRWKSVEDRVLDVAFTPSGNGCAVTAFHVSGGQMMTRLYRFDFTKEADKTELWHSDDLATLGISSYFLPSGGLLVFGDTLCAYYDSGGKLETRYEYPADLVDFGYADGTAALLLNNEQRRRCTLVTLEQNGTQTASALIDGTAKHVELSGGEALVMSNRTVDAYTSNGTKVSTVPVGDEYQDFHRVQNYIFLIGFETIDRIDFNG